MTPVRVGFTPTPGKTSRLPSAIAAPTIKNAADEISAGIVISTACKRCPPHIPIHGPSRESLTPKASSMRSVWSRVGAGSDTRVVPDARRPASSTADLTWALAMGTA